MNKMQRIVIRELKGREISVIFPLVAQLSPDVDKTGFRKCLKAMLKEGYRCIGAFLPSGAGKKNGRLVGCAGFWIGTRFWCGPFIEPDNLVIDREHRRSGVGEKLMGWIEKEGRRRRCQIIKLETYTINTKARAFYAKLAYEETGVVITRPLSISREEWHNRLEKKAK